MKLHDKNLNHELIPMKTLNKENNEESDFELDHSLGFNTCIMKVVMKVKPRVLKHCQESKELEANQSAWKVSLSIYHHQ